MLGQVRTQHNITYKCFSVFRNSVLRKRFPFDEIRKRIKGCKVIHFVGLSSKLLRAVTASSSEVEVEVNQCMGDKNFTRTRKSVDSQDLTIITYKGKNVQQVNDICESVEIENQCSLQENGLSPGMIFSDDVSGIACNSAV